MTDPGAILGWILAALGISCFVAPIIANIVFTFMGPAR